MKFEIKIYLKIIGLLIINVFLEVRTKTSKLKSAKCRRNKQGSKYVPHKKVLSCIFVNIKFSRGIFGLKSAVGCDPTKEKIGEEK